MTDASIERPPRWSSVSLTADAMKVLAHPLRSRLLAALRTDGPATATALAEKLTTNTGATSYHLRKLASVGLVEETGAGRGRERWWRPTTEMHNWNDEAAEDDPDGKAATQWLREFHLRAFVEHAERWIASHESWPLEWRRLAGSSDYMIDLTPEQFDAMQRELWSVILRHRDTADAANADARSAGQVPDTKRVLVFLHCFPEGKAPR